MKIIILFIILLKINKMIKRYEVNLISLIGADKTCGLYWIHQF